MSLTLGLRPRIHLEDRGTPEEVAQRIREAKADFIVTVVDHYIVVKIPESRRHYWSPQLQIEMEAQDNGTRVSELITPMPAVWTLFAMSYIAIIVLCFFGGIFGLAQWQLGQKAVGLWSFPVALILLGGVYTAALIGQKIGREQTEELTVFLRGCLEEPPSADH